MPRDGWSGDIPPASSHIRKAGGNHALGRLANVRLAWLRPRTIRTGGRVHGSLSYFYRLDVLTLRITADDPKSPLYLTSPEVVGTLNRITVTIIGYLHSSVENRLCFFQNILG